MRIVIDRRNQAMVAIHDSYFPLAEFVKSKRIEQNLSVSRLENEMGVSHPSWANVEKDKNNSMKVIVRALDVLGYDVIVAKRMEGKPLCSHY